MAEYPGAALTASIIAYAAKHGRLPSRVYRDYKRHPKDYRLVFSYEAWEADEQSKAIEKAKPKTR